MSTRACFSSEYWFASTIILGLSRIVQRNGSSSFRDRAYFRHLVPWLQCREEDATGHTRSEAEVLCGFPCHCACDSVSEFLSMLQGFLFAVHDNYFRPVCWLEYSPRKFEEFSLYARSRFVNNVILPFLLSAIMAPGERIKCLLQVKLFVVKRFPINRLFCLYIRERFTGCLICHGWLLDWLTNLISSWHSTPFYSTPLHSIPFYWNFFNFLDAPQSHGPLVSPCRFNTAKPSQNIPARWMWWSSSTRKAEFVAFSAAREPHFSVTCRPVACISCRMSGWRRPSRRPVKILPTSIPGEQFWPAVAPVSEVFFYIFYPGRFFFLNIFYPGRLIFLYFL